MHIEIRIPEKTDAEKIFDRLRREFLKAEVPLRGVMFEVIRAEAKTFEGRTAIHAMVSSDSSEKFLKHDDVAKKALEGMGFEVKNLNPRS